MVGYRKYSRKYRVWGSGINMVQSQKVTLIEALPVKLNLFDNDYNDDNDDTFLDLESSSA